MDQSERRYCCIVTPFLTPLEQIIAQKVIGKQMVIRFWGGYEQAERKRMLLAPYECEDNFEIVTLKGRCHRAQRQLTHRDVLGAMMHLGIERDQFGDLLVHDEEIYLFVRKELQDFVCTSLTKIARYPIRFAVYEGAVSHENDIAWRASTISRPRLDCIVAACVHASRDKADALIKGKCVKVDHLPLEDCKFLCNNNCTVSIRGYGRFLVRISDRTSRKGRMVIEIGTFQ